MLGLTNFVRPNILKTKKPACSYKQDMELHMTESHMYLQDIKTSPSLTGQNNDIRMCSIRLNLLTKTTWKFKTPGRILVIQVIVQVVLVGSAMTVTMQGYFWRILQLSSIHECPGICDCPKSTENNPAR